MGKPWQQYTGPGKVIRDTYLSKAVVDPSGKVHVFFYGTTQGPDSPGHVKEWAEDFEAGLGKKIPSWDKEIQWYIDHYGFQSESVSYSGFSRGGGLAQYMGGIGYGSGHFYQYAAREGSVNAPSGYNFWSAYDVFNAYLHNRYVEPVSNTADTLLGVVGVGSHDRPHENSAIADHHTYDDYQGKQPVPSMDTRGRSLMKRDPDEEPLDDRPWKKPRPSTPVARGDFSGIQTTLYHPTTGNIINYQGIPRKRKFSALERYSPFWKEQMRLTQTSVLAGPS